MLVLVLVAAVVLVVYFGLGTGAAVAASTPDVVKPLPLLSAGGGPQVFPERNTPEATAAGIDCSNPATATAPECQSSFFKSGLRSIDRMLATGNYATLSPDAPAGALGFRPHATAGAAAPPPPAPSPAGGSGGRFAGVTARVTRMVA